MWCLKDKHSLSLLLGVADQGLRPGISVPGSPLTQTRTSLLTARLQSLKLKPA